MKTQYFNNTKNNHTLTQLWDTSFPKLMRGEVRVKNLI